MNNDIEKMRSAFIFKWFNDLLTNKPPESILILEETFSDINCIIGRLLKEYNYDNSKYIITNPYIYRQDLKKYRGKYVVLILPLTKENMPLLSDNKLPENNLLYVPKKNNFYSNFDNYINPDINKDTTINTLMEEDKYLFYIEPTDPFNLIKVKTDDELITFFKFTINDGYLSWFGYKKYNLLTHDINVDSEDIFEVIKTDLTMLRVNQILTSRLAVLIYRIAKLKPSATVSEVGRYFHKQTGSKSKTLNYELIKKQKTLKGVDLDINLKGKNFKAYDLTVNEFEIAIRKDIAMKLESLNLQGLDSKTIAEITQYSNDD
jgi:hypothetical protein